MLDYEDRQYFTWLTGTRYTGVGAVIDLGTWLGSSAACLAEGLRRSGREGRVISFDRFVWETINDSQLGGYSLGLSEGDDFMPAARRFLEPFCSRVELRRADLSFYHWDEGPIEILVIDAAKSWKLSHRLLRAFGRALIPGVSRIVFQNFSYPFCHWLPLIIGARPDLGKRLNQHKGRMPPRSAYGGHCLKRVVGKRNIPKIPSPGKQTRTIYRDIMDKANPFQRHHLRQGLFRKMVYGMRRNTS